MPNIEFFAKLNPQRLTSLEEDHKAEQKQILADQEQWAKHGTNSIDGYNIRMNCGETAGQTIFHCHVHLIPRRKADVENPRGGIRHVIPEKGYYEDKK